MLSKLDAGWTTFNLSPEIEFDLSYITDVAFDWLDAAINGLETSEVFSVYGFCEPGSIECTVGFDHCDVMFDRDDVFVREDRDPASVERYRCDISMIEFCRRLWSDISGDIDAWTHWDDSRISWSLDDWDDEAAFEAKILERKEELQKMLDMLKQMIDEKEKKI